MSPYGVVVVDLWPIIRMGIGRALPSLNYRILEEVDGAPGLRRALERRRPDLVVLGNHIGEDPVRLVEEVKAGDARILVLVDDPGRSQLRALAKAGADGILAGSASGEELGTAADRVMAGERALSPELVPALAGLARTAGPERVPISPLTAREHQVLEYLVQGARNEEIASWLYLSPATVKTHLSSIYAKLEVRGRHEATARALQLGLVHP